MSDSHHGHHPPEESYASLRTRALESLLAEKGLISGDAIDYIVQKFESDIGPMNGAKVVARAWTDAEYKRRLLEDGTEAVAEMGYVSGQEVQILVLENTPEVHNVVVCTLCSCYPWAVLGLPPTWYKSAAYRSRVVIEPRTVLQEFGLELAPEVEVRVWDSTADLRYMVLPERPSGTEGLSQEELAHLVTRDAMIGVTRVPSPSLVS